MASANILTGDVSAGSPFFMLSKSLEKRDDCGKTRLKNVLKSKKVT
jgi:hypothetical protein